MRDEGFVVAYGACRPLRARESLDVISSIILSEMEKSNQENVKFVFSKQVW